jgi:DNA recombination protein RmuC
MDVLSLIIGIAIGSAIGYLLTNALRKKESGISPEEVERNYIRTERFQDVNLRMQQVDSERKAAEQHNTNLTAQLAQSRERFTGLEQRMAEQKAELEQLQELFKNEFKVLAQSILDETSLKFKEQSKTEVGLILNPFKEKLEAFEKKVDETHRENLKETFSLKTEVKNLTQQSEKLSKEADNLTKALKGEVKTQGNWGEVILERILEKSGLTKDQEYFVQQSVTTEDGRRYQPDVIIKLPDDKNVIVDSKVTLVAYERFASAENPAEQQEHLKQHIAALKAHVRGLSDKNYQSLYGIDGLDFVLLFVPIEGAFSAAIMADNNLFQEAFERNVVIVSTSTLLATLRTIASIWKQEKQTQNAQEIARQAGALYDKFVAFSEDLVKVGNQLDSTKKTYGDAMNKLVEGNGNLIRRAENLKIMGAKTTKHQDNKLLNRAQANELNEE